MTVITDEHLKEFKSLYVKAEGLGIESDEELKNILNTAYRQIVSYSDEFDMDEYPIGRLLVYDYARYIRANASELFFDNFKSQLNNFGFELMLDRGINDDTQQNS